MQVTIIGGGVIGVSTAYALARQGAEVTLLDRQPGPALETSYANAGQISPGYAAPWAAPGIPLKALKWLVQAHAPLAIRPDGTLFQLQWMLSMLGQCSAANYARNKGRMVRLAEYSRDILKDLRAETGIAYEGRQAGTLQVFRSDKQLEAAQRDVRVLQDAGVAHRLMTRSDALAQEPGLERAHAHLVGALYLPGDETGDCAMFTEALAQKAKGLGVQFVYGASVHGIDLHAGQVHAVRYSDASGNHTFASRHVVMAAGSYSRLLARPLGLKLPIYPVKGYSITVPISSNAAERDSPRSTVMDETYKIAITRFDQRIRVGGMAELGGFDLRLRAARLKTLTMVLESLFPGVGNTAQPQFWTGLRPMTPDGTPIVGRTSIKGLWLNTGHGTLGWTMACGSARVLADQMTGRKPAIAHDDLSLARYGAVGKTQPLRMRPAST